MTNLLGSNNGGPPVWAKSGKCIGLIKVAEGDTGDHQLSPSCELDDGNIIPIKGRGAAFWEQKMESGEFKSGETEVSGCDFVRSSQGGDAECFIPPGHTRFLSNVVKTDNQEEHERRKLAIVGEKTILVVRVIAANDTTTSSEDALVGNVFTDSVNVATQYTACSNGQLNFQQTDDMTLTGTNDGDETGITNGVTTVRVPMATETDIATALNQNFNVTHPDELADHVMYCMPPGAMSGIAYAYINSWLSVYSDNWCYSVSAQMHEIGYNLGLAHSGEEGGDRPNDQTGMVSDDRILTDSILYYKDLTHQCA